MFLLFNMLSRLFIAFLPRSKRLLISWPQSPSAVILKPTKIKSFMVSIVSPSICHEVMGLDAVIFIFWMWILSQLSNSPLSLSSRGSLVPLCFPPQGWCHLYICGYLYFFLQPWFQLVLNPVCHFTWCTLHVSYLSRVTIHSLDVLLSQFGTTSLFHFWF